MAAYQRFTSLAMFALATIATAVRIRRAPSLDGIVHHIKAPKVPDLRLVQKRAASKFWRLMQRGFIDVSDDGEITLTRLKNHIPTDTCDKRTTGYKLCDKPTAAECVGSFTPAECLKSGHGHKVKRNPKDVMSVVEHTLRDLKAVLEVVGVEELRLEGLAGGMYAEGMPKYRDWHADDDAWVPAWKEIAKLRADNIKNELDLDPSALAVTTTTGHLSKRTGVKIHITSKFAISALRADVSAQENANDKMSIALDAVSDEAHAVLKLQEDGKDAVGVVLADIVERIELALSIGSEHDDSEQSKVLATILKEAKDATDSDDAQVMIEAIENIAQQADGAFTEDEDETEKNPIHEKETIHGDEVEEQQQPTKRTKEEEPTKRTNAHRSMEEQGLEDIFASARVVLERGNIRFNPDDSVDLIKFPSNKIPFQSCEIDHADINIKKLSECSSEVAVESGHEDDLDNALNDIAEIGTLLGLTDMQVVGQARKSKGLWDDAEKQGKLDGFEAGCKRLAAARANLLVDRLMHQEWAMSGLPKIQVLKDKMESCIASKSLEDVDLMCKDVAAFGKIGVVIKMQTLVNAQALQRSLERGTKVYRGEKGQLIKVSRML